MHSEVGNKCKSALVLTPNKKRGKMAMENSCNFNCFSALLAGKRILAPGYAFRFDLLDEKQDMRIHNDVFE